MRVTELTADEDARAQRLLDAQAKAAELFRAVEARGAATGSWISTWSTAAGRSAASTRNCSTSAADPEG
jgi:hypothetical protein